jgi:DNA-binding transcriptional ArsR family regulator
METMASINDERRPGKGLAGEDEYKLKDMLILDRPEDIKMIFSEKHGLILNLIKDKAMSISDLARSVNMNPGSVHYHLKGLEKHGLVMLVREEVKGGVVKKYYRAAAKRILLDAPSIYSSDSLDIGSIGELVDRLIRSIEHMGYYLPPGNVEDARDLLFRYNGRMKKLMIESSGFEDVEDNGIILNYASNLVRGVRMKNDPEMARIYSEFEKLFLPHE